MEVEDLSRLAELMWDDFGTMAKDDLALRRKRFMLYVTGDGIRTPTSSVPAARLGCTDGSVSSTAEGVSCLTASRRRFLFCLWRLPIPHEPIELLLSPIRVGPALTDHDSN